MELTSKQRAYLRGLANTLEPIVIIGKDGIGENLVKQANDALEARELIKCRVLENSMLTAREACDALCVLTRSEQVQVIGTRFVLYRPTHRNTKRTSDKNRTGYERKILQTIVYGGSSAGDTAFRLMRPGASAGRLGRHRRD